LKANYHRDPHLEHIHDYTVTTAGQPAARKFQIFTPTARQRLRAIEALEKPAIAFSWTFSKPNMLCAAPHKGRAK
jgi:hypothetical protein